MRLSAEKWGPLSEMPNSPWAFTRLRMYHQLVGITSVMCTVAFTDQQTVGTRPRQARRVAARPGRELHKRGLVGVRQPKRERPHLFGWSHANATQHVQLPLCENVLRQRAGGLWWTLDLVINNDIHKVPWLLRFQSQIQWVIWMKVRQIGRSFNREGQMKPGQTEVMEPWRLICAVFGGDESSCLVHSWWANCSKGRLLCAP